MMKKEDRGPLDLTLLVEQHAKEIWAFKEQLSGAVKELTVLRGTKGVVTQLSGELIRMKKDKKELEERIAELLEIDGAHQRQMGKVQVRLTELEEDNKKLAHQVEDIKMDNVRKAGM